MTLGAVALHDSESALISEARKVAERAKKILNLSSARLPNVYYYSSITLCVLDAVFSIGVRYEGTEAVVRRYCAYYGQTRIRSNRATLPSREEQEPLTSLIDRIEAIGADRFAGSVVRSRQRTSPRNGILKAEAAALFAKVLVRHGVEFLAELPLYDPSSALVADLRAVKGQASGISVDYFWMLAGSDDLIKPDRMIVGFLQETLERQVSVSEARELLPATAIILQANFPRLRPRLLDYEIWKYQRSKARLTDMQV